MSEPTDARLSAGAYAPGTAPRVTAEEVEEVITKIDFIVMPDGRTTICQLTLRNGFTVRGESSCVFIENFLEEKGREISLAQAKGKVWMLEAYLLAQRHFEDSIRYAGN